MNNLNINTYILTYNSHSPTQPNLPGVVNVVLGHVMLFDAWTWLTGQAQDKDSIDMWTNEAARRSFRL